LENKVLDIVDARCNHEVYNKFEYQGRRKGVDPSPCMKILRKFGKWFARLNKWN